MGSLKRGLMGGGLGLGLWGFGAICFVGLGFQAASMVYRIVVDRQPENGWCLVVVSIRLALTMRLVPTGHLLFFASPKCEPAFIIRATAFAP